MQRPGFYCAGRSIVVGPSEAAAGLALLADVIWTMPVKPPEVSALDVELRDGPLPAAESDDALVDAEAAVEQVQGLPRGRGWLQRLE